MVSHRHSKVPVTKVASMESNMSQVIELNGKDAMPSKDSGLMQGDAPLSSEHEIYAIARFATEDKATIERAKQEFEEWFKNGIPVGNGDENDPANPYMIEKYGDQLPMKWRDVGKPWELWVDTLGRFYYLNTITKEVKYSFGADDDIASSRDITQAQTSPERPCHAAQAKEAELLYETRSSKTK